MKYIKTYEQQNNPLIKYYNNGQKESEHYIVNGQHHREDGPAHQRWYINGQKEFERYFINGKWHRENGPAVQLWYDNGQKQTEYYYINDKEYSREDWIKELKEINSPHYEEQLMIYNAEKYNL
jgi:antitoxin component YwqK of YwqJK toxin-antitoxin module